MRFTLPLPLTPGSKSRALDMSTTPSAFVCQGRLRRKWPGCKLPVAGCQFPSLPACQFPSCNSKLPHRAAAVAIVLPPANGWREAGTQAQQQHRRNTAATPPTPQQH
ncbi:GM24790 [Drosophila sechellia]|uniref:GM24790 n=1 Tax=Drosophila sechellia TaxID=7238 RepID=B4HDT3_DROSE|nr:GM24790 [Drosophila sechellia]